MSDIGDIISNLNTGIAALKMAKDLAESANVGSEHVAAIEQAEATLKATRGSMYDLAMKRGLDHDMAIGHAKELKSTE
jgi:hypothetical protein